MEQRRFLLFLVLSMSILIGWNLLVVPRFFPQPVKQQQADDAEPREDGQAGKQDAAEDAPAGNPAQVADADAPVKAEKPKPPLPPKPAEIKIAKHPREMVQLGSLDPESGYFSQVTLTSQGAAVEQIDLNDIRYKNLKDREAPLSIVQPVGDLPDSQIRTLQSPIDLLDQQLKKQQTSLNELDWEVFDVISDQTNPKINTSVVFRIISPDKTLEVRKRYELFKAEPLEEEGEKEVNPDTATVGYELKCDLIFKNLSDTDQTLVYQLQGPVGLPLENADNTRKFRDVRVGFLDEEEGVYKDDNEDGFLDKTADTELVTMTAAEVIEAIDDEAVETWKRPFKYIGVDVQYFTALLQPGGDQFKTPYIEVARAVLVDKKKPETNSDISIALKSHLVTVSANSEVKHSYKLYTGPKRQKLLEPLGASDVIDFGMFGWVSKFMLWILTSLNNWLSIPYGFAIIFLTIMVRGAMYPVSKKQAVGAKRMKELQPKIAELKKKYGKDREKMAKAQMELFSEHNYNPLAGCLPVFFQLPIFIGLYQALNNAVDLRMAPFLWISNLAAPDALFPLPFEVPIVGWKVFNLLPIITIVLFILQQKMFMPQATDDEQKMQQKMMTYMMVFMGFLFYRVPAGLCVYFIASSLWGMSERKWLDIKKEKPPEDNNKITEPDDGPDGNDKPKGFWARLAESADAAAAGSNLDTKSDNANKQNGTKKKKGKSKGRR